MGIEYWKDDYDERKRTFTEKTSCNSTKLMCAVTTRESRIYQTCFCDIYDEISDFSFCEVDI